MLLLRPLTPPRRSHSNSRKCFSLLHKQPRDFIVATDEPTCLKLKNIFRLEQLKKLVDFVLLLLNHFPCITAKNNYTTLWGAGKFLKLLGILVKEEDPEIWID
ncbi:hypothetical protein OPV22_000385 [Ensete ventricosum]|uniref:Uncharacterized protein n=1 Tax=Ensete ventricosum TaxID=4639 RepID=A0AAV8RQ14_ENSVE|nr:hypothetical protein OPV22_000385 [Ensete ventricosum]